MVNIFKRCQSCQTKISKFSLNFQNFDQFSLIFTLNLGASFKYALGVKYALWVYFFYSVHIFRPK